MLFFIQSLEVITNHYIQNKKIPKIRLSDIEVDEEYEN